MTYPLRIIKQGLCSVCETMPLDPSCNLSRGVRMIPDDDENELSRIHTHLGAHGMLHAE